MNFTGVLPKGTPVAQCVPVKREDWVAETAPLTAEETQRVHELTKTISREPGLYRRQFRA
jgi:antitoxin (DNA-binding transcriptional repressor) of toxin-antitoxin stability system